LDESWNANAACWTAAVRGGGIGSRRITDRAVLKAIGKRAPARLLDLGCGEGWLLRAVKERSDAVCLGVDGSAALVAAARAADPEGDYACLSYREVADGALGKWRPFDLIVCNFALFEEDLLPLLSALRHSLTPEGQLLIQTLHPWSASGGDYRDGWRREDFGAFPEEAWQPMRWYYRRLETWVAVLRAAGYRLNDLREPCDEEGKPLSLMLQVAVDA